MTNGSDTSQQGHDNEAWVGRQQAVAGFLKLGFTREEARELLDDIHKTERELGIVPPEDATGSGRGA